MIFYSAVGRVMLLVVRCVSMPRGFLRRYWKLLSLLLHFRQLFTETDFASVSFARKLAAPISRAFCSSIVNIARARSKVTERIERDIREQSVKFLQERTRETPVRSVLSRGPFLRERRGLRRQGVADDEDTEPSTCRLPVWLPATLLSFTTASSCVCYWNI